MSPRANLTKRTMHHVGAIRAGIAGVLIFLLLPLADAQDADPKLKKILAAIVRVRAEVPATARTATSLGTEREGSGVVIDANGLIVTIGYLILEAARVKITLASNRDVPTEILAYDHNTGFGLLRALQPINVQPIMLGRSAELKKSAGVLVFSFGGTEAVQPAIVVSRRPYAGYWEYLLEDAIFTSPPYPNFGGAALIGPEGKLLGIGSLIVGDALTGERQVAGNMFVPIDKLKDVFQDLLTFGRASAPARPWLGIYSEEHRGHLFVTRLATEGPAVKAGIQQGDIIVAVGETAVNSMADFYRRVWAHGNAGVGVTLTVLRQSKLLKVSIKSADRYNWLRLNPL